MCSSGPHRSRESLQTLDFFETALYPAARHPQDGQASRFELRIPDEKGAFWILIWTISDLLVFGENSGSGCD
jgi:hypothetical protein